MAKYTDGKLLLIIGFLDVARWVWDVWTPIPNFRMDLIVTSIATCCLVGYLIKYEVAQRKEKKIKERGTND